MNHIGHEETTCFDNPLTVRAGKAGACWQQPLPVVACPRPLPVLTVKRALLALPHLSSANPAPIQVRQTAYTKPVGVSGQSFLRKAGSCDTQQSTARHENADQFVV